MHGSREWNPELSFCSGAMRWDLIVLQLGSHHIWFSPLSGHAAFTRLHHIPIISKATAQRDLHCSWRWPPGAVGSHACHEPSQTLHSHRGMDQTAGIFFRLLLITTRHRAENYFRIMYQHECVCVLGFVVKCEKGITSKFNTYTAVTIRHGFIACYSHPKD